ncbi:MAG: hypothetical protein IKE50_05390 [Erysipelotrichaceae bacterium]|nr:hypothetical protein [Erysipelotrichaceae bacterium]
MSKNHSFSLDKLLVFLSILYVTIPVLVFFFGWLKEAVALFAAVPFFFFVYFVCKDIIETETKLFTKETYIYWIIAIAVICIWVYFSGIGAFSFQNGDHWVRNPIYRDLCSYRWPVIYDLSKEPAFVQSITGSDPVAFSYYFTFWLVPALISKVFGLSELGCNIILFLWSVTGLLLILYNMNRIIGKCSVGSLLMLVFFSGMDILRCVYYGKPYQFIEHIEWWGDLYRIQYSSNTTQLYWVFNQSIPLWLIICLTYQLQSNKYLGALYALSFAYSPWAIFGVIPIALVGSFSKKQNICQVFNLINIITTLLTAGIYGLFYVASSGSSGGIGTTLSYYRTRLFGFLIDYFIFVLTEFILYWLFVYKEKKNDKYFWIVSMELLLFPMVWMRDGNFTMRASIPALFIFMLYIIETMNRIETKSKIVLTAMLLIGSLTPISEINRSIKNTLIGNYDNEEEIYSFGNIQTRNEARIKIVKDQFFIYDYNESIFFKSLGK